MSYYQNKYLIYVIAQIGSHYDNPSIRTAYKRGLKIIQKAVIQKGKYVSLMELKRLVRPNYKRKHIIKYPRKIEFDSIYIAKNER